jgi:surfeit locus 1 family protein
LNAPPAKVGSGIFSATVFAVCGIALLIGLGVWQLERKVWKENLIASITARTTQAPQALPPRAEWPKVSQQHDEFRRVTFAAEFVKGQDALVYSAGSALRPDVTGAGYWVFTPARLADGSLVVVDRGFVPFDRKDAASGGLPQGPTSIVGVMRWPEKPGLFTPVAEPQNDVWYARDLAAMAGAKQWGPVAPFYIDQESPAPPGGWPKPGKVVVALPDNHLQYAITWFGLALGLAAVYGIWVSRRLAARI